MNTSSNGVKFIACREALVTVAYEDGKHADGTPKYSEGFGSQDREPRPGDKITIEAAFAQLKANIAARDLTISRAITVPIQQHEFDAVSSLYYQSGTKALRHVAAIFNAGKPVLAIGSFIAFALNNGVPSDGLTKRRIREMAMAIDGWYGDLTRVKVFDGNPREVEPYWLPFPEDI